MCGKRFFTTLNKPSGGDLKQFVKRVVELYHPYKRAVLGVFGFIACSQAVNLVAPYLQGKVIDNLINSRSIGQIYLLVVATFVMTMLQISIGYFREWYEIKHLDFAVPRHVRKTSMEKVLGFSIGQHTNENSGIKQSILQRGQNSLTTLAMQTLYMVIPTAVEVILLIGVLMWFSLTIGSVALLGIIGYGSFILYTNLTFRADYKKLEEMHNDYSKFQGEVLRNVEVVLSNSQEDRAVKECDENFGAVSDFGRDIGIRFNRFSSTRNLILGFVRFMILSTGVYLVFKGYHTVGQLVMFLSWSGQALGQVSNVGSLHRQLIQLYTSVQKYFDMLAIEPDVKVLPNPVRPASYAGKIEFRKVTLRYKRRGGSDEASKEGFQSFGEQYPALNNASFTIESGQTVAFVGESGAGKSSVVSILLRSQDPEEGQIVIDGHDLRILDLKHFRESIGIVDQEVSLFDNTLRYNITFGLNGRSSLITDSDLDRISEMSCINRFFPRLENGYETIIGERGIKLSGGEKQRVGIARALIKDPDILIFDEATSNLDSENEALIRESIEKASEGRTTIIIAHRFSTIRRVDKVIVFEKGQVVGEGTHEELTLNCVPYQRLIRNQMI
jgi:ABC-type multidrug transport system fused ATPase/permease subunit